MIPVTKAYMPNQKKYQDYVRRILESQRFTNNGIYLQELEKRLSEYLGVRNIICVSNGSLALQLAYKALSLKGEVITTPFSFVATTSTLVWEGLKPIFSDICPKTFNINSNNIRKLITKETSAILPVHVYGNPCEVDRIKDIANKNNLKVIYDASHAFGVEYNENDTQMQSILNYGDISTISFHSTKLFHTIEGGALITNDDVIAKKIRQMVNFGISKSNTIEMVGTNAKMNEMEAAMGLCVLDEIDFIRSDRKRIWNEYQRGLTKSIAFQQWSTKSQNNHAYAPILFKSEEELLNAENRLKEKNIFPRRYFYPSLDSLDYLQENFGKFEYKNRNSMDISSRVLCLPIYPGLTPNEQSQIIDVLNNQ